MGLALLTLSWLVPNHYRPWSSFHSEALAFAGMSLLVLGCLLTQRGRPGIEVPAVGVAVFLLAFVPWLQFAAGLSAYAGDAVVVSLYLVATAGAVWAGYADGTSPQSSKSAFDGLVGAIGVGAFASAVIGLLQWLSLDEHFISLMFQSQGNGRAIGNLAQANHLGTLLLMGMISVGYAFERRVIGRAGLVAAVAFMSAVLVLTQSRTAILSAVAVAIFLLARKNSFHSRLPTHLIGLWIALFLLASWLLPSFADALLVGGARGSLTYTHTSDRLLIWQQITYAISQAPWFGYGWNLTPTASLVGAYQYPGDLTYSYAHSIVLDLLAWNGVPLGLLMTAACLVWIISRGLRVISRNGFYAFAMLLPLVVHSLLEYPFAYAYFLLPAGFLVGTIEASLDVRRIVVRRRYAGLVLGSLLIVGSYLSYEYFLIEEDFRIVRFEGMRVGKTPEEYDVPRIWLATHMGSMLRAARQPAKPGLTAEEMSNLRNAAMRFPYGALTYRYALALGLNGDPAGARRMMATIRGTYGERYYQAVRDDMQTQANEQYPELKAVNPP